MGTGLEDKRGHWRMRMSKNQRGKGEGAEDLGRVGGVKVFGTVGDLGCPGQLKHWAQTKLLKSYSPETN